jgi:acyl carrier protein
LPAPEWQTQSDTAPRTATEQTLAAIWCDVLKRDRVGINDNFFELGGDSLSATRAIARVQQKLDVAVPLKAMFETPTLEELAKRIEVIGWAAMPDTGPLAAEAAAELEEGVLG